METGDGFVILTNGANGGALATEIRNALSDAIGYGVNPPIRTIALDLRADLDMQDIAVEVIDHVEGAEPTSACEHVAHEIERPDRIEKLWDVQRDPLTLWQAPIRGTSFVGARSS